MKLSKANDCLPHDFFIVKLVAYGFENTALGIITDYLTKCLWQTTIEATFSSYLEIFRNVPQGSILFNFFIKDLMFFKKTMQFCNFANDTTIYSCSLNYEEAHHKISNDTTIVPNWFRVNSMVANPGKFQIIFLRSSINNNSITFIVENKHIKSLLK